jgi:hypothetical protein
VHKVGDLRGSVHGPSFLTVSVRTSAAKSHSGVSARSSGPARTPVRRRYFWARHPEIAGGSVHHVQAVSSRVNPVSPASPPGRTEPCCCYTFYYSARNAKDLSLPERALTCGNW